MNRHLTPCGAPRRSDRAPSATRSEPIDSWRRLGSLAGALLAAAVSIGEAIDGAPTSREQNLLAATGATAVFLMWLAADAPRATRRPPTAVTVPLLVAAAALAVARLSRLMTHLAQRRDEPTIDASLAAQTTLAVAALVAIAAISRPRRTRHDPPVDHVGDFGGERTRRARVRRALRRLLPAHRRDRRRRRMLLDRPVTGNR